MKQIIIGLIQWYDFMYILSVGKTEKSTFIKQKKKKKKKKKKDKWNNKDN